MKSIFITLMLFFLFQAAKAQKALSGAALLELKQFEQLISKAQEEGDKRKEAGYLNQVAYIYLENADPLAAAGYFKKSLALNRELGNQNAVKNLSNSLGSIYYELEDFHAALNYFNESLKINRSLHKKQDVAYDLQNIAQVEFELKQYAPAVKKLEEAAGIALEFNDIKLTQSCYLQLAENFEKLGDNQKSKNYYEKSSALLSQLQKKQIENIESQKNLAETKAIQTQQKLQTTMDTLAEYKESLREIQLKNELMTAENNLKDMAIKEAEAREKAGRIFRYYSITAIVLMIFILTLIYYQFRQKKNANRQLTEQKKEIEKQRDFVQEQNQKITDSIQYAQRIQNALLPPRPLLDNILKDYFVLFIPRDIVSGDFYWISQKENSLILVAADCTGHGVPGAFMSMLGMAFLNEIVNKIAVNRHISSLQADEILNELRKNIIGSLHQTGDKDEPKDGMDISLCIIDFEAKRLQFAGAHNPLYIIRNNELMQYSGDKMPLSYHKNKDVPFTKHEVNLQPGDLIYIFSDGYLDQFGGDKGFKFLSKNFKELLLRVHQLPLHEQQKILLEEHEQWKGQQEQLDDILVIGFRYTGKKPAKTPDERYNWQDRQILIAEDTDVNYFLLAEALRETKAKLVRVKNGREAVEFCKTNHIDLILMDINMPDMNGYEATTQIKSFKKDIPVIVQTALNTSNEKEISLQAGADDYIAKPIELKAFLTKLGQYLD
ncbi:MAG: response regulator [Bacteroidales bacterium]|nr:response regulator [Bacteroidales bacterium]